MTGCVMVVIYLAEGFELIEALTPVDYLRRAGIDAKTASVAAKNVKSSCGVEVAADMAAAEVDHSAIEAIVLPGGMPGAANLASDAAVAEAIDKAVAGGRTVAAICAAPALVLGARGLLRERSATCYPSFCKELSCNQYLMQSVVYDAPFLTGRAAGAASEFSIRLIEILRGKEAAQKIMRDLCL